jgi:hypothetical protein
MPIKRLIENQKISIDNHMRGQIVDERLRGVHIHKSFLEGKYKKNWVKINIIGDEITFSNKLDPHEQAHIIKEINKVIETDRQALIGLADFVADALWRWSQYSVSVEEARVYARNIAEMFGLNKIIQEELIRNVDEELRRYISIHKDDKNQCYLIDQSRTRIVVAPGKVQLTKRREVDSPPRGQS